MAEEAANIQPIPEPTPQPGAWDTTAMSAAYDEKLSPAPEPALEPEPVAAPAPAPIIEEPPATEVPEAAAPTPTPEAVAPDLALLQETHAAVEGIGGIDELNILHSIAAPLVAPELDPDGFFAALEENRGTAATDSLLWRAYERYGDSYIEEAFRALKPLLMQPDLDPNTFPWNERRLGCPRPPEIDLEALRRLEGLVHEHRTRLERFDQEVDDLPENRRKQEAAAEQARLNAASAARREAELARIMSIEI